MTSQASALIPLIIALAGCATPLERQQSAEAPSFAEHWLAHVDAGDQEAAWLALSEVARLRVEKQVQLKLWFGTRQSMGALLSRRLEFDWEYDARLLRSAPAGTYWEVAFRTDFENKEDVIEDLLLRWERGGWRLFGFQYR